MTDSLRVQILKVASDVLEVPVEQLADESSAENLKNWDSIQHLTMVLALEQKLGIRFEPEEIESMTSLRAIEEIVRAKQ
jgi:acyl carrier protein